MSHFQSENNMMLYNETSPVNSAFISNAITKHQSYPNSNQFNTNGHNQQANYFRQVYNPPGNNQAMNRYTVGQPNGANSQSNSNNINLHLACNNCGKILLDKAPVGLIENNRNAVFASIHRGRSNTINSGNVVNFGNSNGHLGAQQQHSTHYYQPNVQCKFLIYFFNQQLGSVRYIIWTSLFKKFLNFNNKIYVGKKRLAKTFLYKWFETE